MNSPIESMGHTSPGLAVIPKRFSELWTIFANLEIQIFFHFSHTINIPFFIFHLFTIFMGTWIQGIWIHWHNWLLSSFWKSPKITICSLTPRVLSYLLLRSKRKPHSQGSLLPVATEQEKASLPGFSPTRCYGARESLTPRVLSYPSLRSKRKPHSQGSLLPVATEQEKASLPGFSLTCRYEARERGGRTWEKLMFSLPCT